MFRVLNRSNIENAIYIQGARHSNTDPIASIVFQNYDYDDNQTYTMAAMSLVNSSGEVSGSNGYGDLVFKSKTPLSMDLVEKMRMTHDGKFNVSGSLTASNMNTGEIVTSNIVTRLYKTERISFTKYTSSNYVQNLVLMLNSNVVQLDASCLVSGVLAEQRIPNISAAKITSGNLSPNVFPNSLVLNDIMTSNFIAYTNTSTPRISFIRGSNQNIISVGSNINITVSNISAYGNVHSSGVRVGFPGFNDDIILRYHDYKDWNTEVVADSNITLTTVHARYARLNNIIHHQFHYILILPATKSNIAVTLPIAPKYTVSRAALFTSISGSDVLGRIVMDSNTSNMHFKSASLTTGHWHISDSVTYEGGV